MSKWIDNFLKKFKRCDHSFIIFETYSEDYFGVEVKETAVCENCGKNYPLKSGYGSPVNLEGEEE